MPVLGITGGVATGKSTFTRALLGKLPAELFDADSCARELLDRDLTIRQELQRSFPPEVFSPGGEIMRGALRDVVFADRAARQKLEAILHPVIRARWLARAAEARDLNCWLFVDIPLLFETRAEAHFDRIAVVACSRAIQTQRLLEARGLSEILAEQIVASQIELSSKVTRADHLIWNEAAPHLLETQAELLAACLKQHYG